MYIFKHHFQGSIMIMKIKWIGWMNTDTKGIHMKVRVRHIFLLIFYYDNLLFREKQDK